MKSSEARKLIGKHVTWFDSFCPARGGLMREAVLIEIKGKNALVDQQGTIDWKWLPNMIDLKQKE
jgi:hypothetical protein